MKRPRIPRWLYPGMRLERWLFLLFLGIAILGLGAAIFIRDLYRSQAADEIAIVYWLTGAWMDPTLRAAVVALTGLMLTGIGMWGLIGPGISPFIARGGSVMEVLYTKRYLARGPRMVAIGGGTGLSTLLRGIKGYSANITAVVAVAVAGGLWLRSAGEPSPVALDTPAVAVMPFRGASGDTVLARAGREPDLASGAKKQPPPQPPKSRSLAVVKMPYP